MRWGLVRLALRLVPRSWRETVARDLDEEAETSGRGTVWLSSTAARAGLALRVTIGAGTLASDLRDVTRCLRRAPGFTVAAILTFALGIGVNVAVFSVVDQMLFRPLPYGEADRLVHLHSLVQSRGPSPQSHLPQALMLEIRARARSFEDVAFSEGRGDPHQIAGLGTLTLDTASYNLLDVLEVRPVIGRGFTVEDARLRSPLLLLREDIWTARFNRSPDVLTRRFGDSEEFPHRVAGILPAGFLAPSSMVGGGGDGLLLSRDVFEGARQRGLLGPSVIARLRPGSTIAEAQAEVDVIVAQLGEPAANPMLSRVTVQPIRSGLFFFYGPYAWAIVAGAWIVLLVGCVNLATLLLARNRSRERDLAIRVSVGASRARIVRAALIESCLLCLVGMAIAVAMAQAAFRTLLAIVPAGLRGVAVAPLDVRLVALASLAALACATLAGLIPALRRTRADVLGGLREDSRTASPGLRGAATLLAAEALFGVVLVAGAALTVHSFLGMVFKSPGYEPNGLYDVRVSHGWQSGAPYYAPERVRTILQALRGRPGVESVGVASRLPVGKGLINRSAFWEAHGIAGHEVAVGGGFFQTLRTPILAGREFIDEDLDGRAAVAMVNRSAIRALWPGTTPAAALGRTVETAEGARHVVGVVADIHSMPGERASPGLYLPITAAEAQFSSSNVMVALRTIGEQPPDSAQMDRWLEEFFGPSRSRVRVESIAGLVAPHLQRPRFQAFLFGSFAVIALLLAAVGLYAVAAFNVARRRYEMGVRLTLGATAAQVRRLVIRGAVTPVLIGSAVGLVITWWAARFLQAFLFEVDARDPWTYGLVGITLVATAALAAWLPARRAARTDPATVLRAM